MAEEQEVQSHEDLQNSTLEVMERELESIQTQEEEVNVEVQPEANEETNAHAPTYQEAEAAQQVSADTEDDRQEEPTEAVSSGEGDKAQSELEAEDAEVYGNLKPKAQERFEHWISKAKGLESENENLKVSGELHDYIMDSGTNAEQLNWSLGVFKSLNSGNYDEAVKALQALDQFADQIGKTLGVNKTEKSEAGFSDFEDLSTAVENMEISEDWANRLANDRISTNSQNQAQADYQQYYNQQLQNQTATQATTEEALSLITEWENDLIGSDPDFSSKRDTMMEISREVASSDFPPEQWLGILQNQYNVLSRGMNVAASANGNASKNSGPLAPGRTNSGTGNVLDSNQAEATPEFLQAHLDAMHN
tara:strand:+ start:360 stop:1454 length:1095 start_codon:yes stop_codon:yes gene_type:complete